LGTTYPNPLVGSVIVYENKSLAKAGIKAGEPQVNAVNSVKIIVAKSYTIYVSLERAVIFGKNTCCDL
jgi:diaminohydroxyphosphoribosylaminopyrimidine deaminase/5-amino-6-(5-phosphoribosylamino)uracil reductase